MLGINKITRGNLNTSYRIIGLFTMWIKMPLATTADPGLWHWTTGKKPGYRPNHRERKPHTRLKLDLLEKVGPLAISVFMSSHCLSVTTCCVTTTGTVMHCCGWVQHRRGHNVVLLMRCRPTMYNYIITKQHTFYNSNIAFQLTILVEPTEMNIAVSLSSWRVPDYFIDAVNFDDSTVL